MALHSFPARPRILDNLLLHNDDLTGLESERYAQTMVLLLRRCQRFRPTWRHTLEPWHSQTTH